MHILQLCEVQDFCCMFHKWEINYCQQESKCHCCQLYFDLQLYCSSFVITSWNWQKKTSSRFVSLPTFCASAERLVLARGTKKRGRGVAVGFKRMCSLSSFRTECECFSHNCRLLIAMLRNESCIQQHANKYVTQHTERRDITPTVYATRYNVFPSAVAICIYD